MGYIDSNLMNGEEVLHRGKIHGIVFVPGLIWVGLSLFFFANAVRDDLYAILGTAFIALGFLSLARAFLYFISTELAVTNRRVIAKVGFISRHTIELNHNRFESLGVTQDILGRILDFGTILVGGTGGSKMPIRNITSPLDFRKQAMQIVDAGR